MHIKNISSSRIKIDDLDLDLRPGEIKDILTIDLNILKTHKMLSIYFEKGILMNLGNITAPVGSKSFLNKAKERAEKAGMISNSVTIQKSKTRELIKSITTNIPRPTDRKPIEASEETIIDEYVKKEVKTRQQTFEDVTPKYLGDDGQIYFEVGQVPTSILTGETTFLNPEKEAKQENKLVIRNAIGDQVEVNLEKVKAKLLERCVGITTAGKPCKKVAVPGFRTCIKHMTKEDEEKYNKLKNKYKEDSE